MEMETKLYVYEFDDGFKRYSDEPPSGIVEGMKWYRNPAATSRWKEIEDARLRQTAPPVEEKTAPETCIHGNPINQFKCQHCDFLPMVYGPDWSPTRCEEAYKRASAKPEADWSVCDHGRPWGECSTCFPKIKVTVTLKCKDGREGCLGTLTQTIELPRDVAPPTEFRCANCAGKIDKRGRFRRARPRKSLTIDNPTYRLDKRQSIRKPGGMTEPNYKPEYPQGEVKTPAQRIRENAVEFLTVITDPEERRILELFQQGLSYQQISDVLAVEGIKCSKPNVPLRLNKVVAEARHKLAATGGRSPHGRNVSSKEFMPGTVADIEGSEYSGAMRIPIPGEQMFWAKGNSPAYRVGAAEIPNPLAGIGYGRELDDLEDLDFVLGLDREGAGSGDDSGLDATTAN
jgi:hypothetical protein